MRQVKHQKHERINIHQNQRGWKWKVRKKWNVKELDDKNRWTRLADVRLERNAENNNKVDTSLGVFSIPWFQVLNSHIQTRLQMGRTQWCLFHIERETMENKKRGVPLSVLPWISCWWEYLQSPEALGFSTLGVWAKLSGLRSRLKATFFHLLICRRWKGKSTTTEEKWL